MTLRNEGKILLISAYLPSSSSKDSVLEYHETIDQLHELFQKYLDTHTIIIGGDLNADLAKDSVNNRRKKYLMDFISEFNLKFSAGGKTFINTAGQECSEIDYFLHQSQSEFNMSEKRVLKTLTVILQITYQSR